MRTGVSISTNPRSSKYSCVDLIHPVPEHQRFRWRAGRRRSRYRYFRRRSSPASVSSSMGNGGVSALFRMVSSPASTSISPVSSSAFAVPSGRRFHGPRHGDHELAPELFRRSAWAAASCCGMKHDLGLAVPVAEVDEDHPPEIPPGIHPAVECDRFPDVGRAELAAGLCALWKRGHLRELPDME